MHEKLDLNLDDLRVRTFEVDLAEDPDGGTVHALCEPYSDCALCSQCTNCSDCTECSNCSECSGCSAWTGDTCGLFTWY